MLRVAQATGAAVQTTVNELNPVVLGTCETFEEVQVRSPPALSQLFSVDLRLLLARIAYFVSHCGYA